MASTIKGLPVYSVKGKFGQHLQTFATQLSTSDVLGVLGHDPSSKNWKNLPQHLREIYDNTQRVTKASRSAGTAEYIRDRFSNSALPGAFPAICIGLTEPIEFTPFKDQTGNDTAAGTSWISMSSTRILLDGLARVTGAIEEAQKFDLENLFNFPAILYAPAHGQALDVQRLGQLFFDFNALQTTVPSAMAMALDHSDVYIQFSNRLGDMPFFKQIGGVERKKSSLGKKSTAFTTQQSLVRTVRGAMEGRAFQESDSARVEKPNLTWSSFEQRASDLHGYFEALGQQFGSRIKDRESFLYTSPGIQVLGLLFHDLYFRANLSPVDKAYFIQKIAAIDWSRYNPDWINLLGQPETDDKGNVVTDDQGRSRIALGKAGANTIRSLVKYLRDKTELSKVLPGADEGSSSDEAATREAEEAELVTAN